MPNLRTFTRRLFIILNILASLFFLLACANPFLHPGKWGLISLSGLAFPFLLAAVTGFFIIGLFLPSYRRWSILSLLTLVVGWSSIRSFLAMHPGKKWTAQKSPRCLRVMTWNVRSFDEFVTKKRGALGHRPRMMSYIDSQKADVLCLQEFFESRSPKELYSNINYIRQRLNYPYYFFSRDYIRYDGSYEAGVVLFSRYPIVDSSVLRYSRPDGLRATESLIAADIRVGNDTIRVFTTHLQSVLFRSKDFHDIEIIKNVDDSILSATKSIAKKLRYAFKHRGDQAVQVREQLEKCPYPGIICGDFNDVPNSYTYHTIRGDWQDAFLKKGFGIGRTYVHLSPTLRIDYILASSDFNVLQCSRFVTSFSDHHPVVADLELQPD
ncbi:MAG: endonuclease/exonuclease/phosphatase family protein [Bacteroidetes bacterium]|nr:endonuclease/exonuclease/phosphatase family protein [Bacteroidota bacterium]